jgi:type VI secretion system protein ImpJ
MSTPTVPPEAVQWHEGMLLTPQHFQQAFQRQDMVINYQQTLATPYRWGVIRLQMDQTTLVGGQLRVLDLEAVMPDGLVVSHPLDGQDLSLDLAEVEEAVREKPQLIYLAVPVQRSASPTGQGELTRYDSVEGRPVADINTGEGAVTIPRLRPRLRLMFEKDLGPAYMAIPLVRLVIREEALGVDSFMPPVLRVTLSSPLGKDCQALARRLREKAAYLVERVRAPTVATADHMITETRSIVASLMGDLPPFEALLNSGVSHPFPLYVSLCALVGKLAALSPELMPPALPPYDHHDLETTFGRALGFARRMVESVHESCMAVPFRMHEGSFSLPLRDSWIRRRLIIGVRHRVGSSEGDVIAWIGNAIIGGASRVQEIGAMRIRGLTREVIDRDESLGITPGRGQTLFALDYDAAYVRPGEPLVVINRNDLRGKQAPSEVVLFVPVDEESGGPNPTTSAPSQGHGPGQGSAGPGPERRSNAPQPTPTPQPRPSALHDTPPLRPKPTPKG